MACDASYSSDDSAPYIYATAKGQLYYVVRWTSDTVDSPPVLYGYASSGNVIICQCEYCKRERRIKEKVGKNFVDIWMKNLGD